MKENKIQEITMNLEIIRYFSAKKRLGENLTVKFEHVFNEKLDFIKTELEDFMKSRGIDYLLLNELILLNSEFKNEKQYYERLEALIEDFKRYIENNKDDLTSLHSIELG